MAFATGADAFTIASFNQTVALDPINPNLRIALGGVYFALSHNDDAIRTFELAAAAKPDLANAHYNWAIALREKGETDKAMEAEKPVIKPPLELPEEATPPASNP